MINTVMDELQNLSKDSRRVIIATSNLDVKIDLAMKMYGKRSKGYRSMGYEIIEKT